MKKIFAFLLLAALSPLGALAQDPVTNSGSDNDEGSLFDMVTGLKTKTDKFHLYLNTHANFNLNWEGDGGTNFEGGKFAFQQLRIEFKGNINDWISYRYRQRLNKGQYEGGYFDNILKAIDIAEVGFRYKKVNFVIGKQCAAYGGIEFDLNPIEIYQYSDMIDYMENFMTGVRVAWDINPKHQLQFQILDALVDYKATEKYGTNIERAKMPFVYTANWNGNFGNVYNTRWSASYMQEIKNRGMWYFAFGNQFNITPKWGMWLDVLYSREGIDRKSIITNVTGMQNNHCAYNTEYLSLIFHTNYFVHPKWNIFGKVAYERNGVYKTSGSQAQGDLIHKGTYGIDYLYIGGVEYYPLKDRGLHFFLTYVGQNQRHTGRAQQYGQPASYYTNMLTCGFIWQVPLF